MKDRKSTRSPDQNSVRVRIPKDYPWKVLSCMADDLAHCLSSTELECVKGIARSRDISAYNLLGEAWGPQSITPNETTGASFFARYQMSALLKKFQFPSDATTRRTAALEKFREAERQCAHFNSIGVEELARLSEWDELCCFTYILSFLRRLLGDELPDEEQLTWWSRHGPGSNLDTKERQTSLYAKYKDWPYSCTSRSLRYARLAIEGDERWIGALENSYRERFSIPPHMMLDRDVFWKTVLKVVPGNRITFVPKNSRIDRSIAIEPAMNLYLQLGVDGYIRRRLKRWGVDLDDQRKNQELARLGSKNWMDPETFVTLDLASASDSISSELCRLVLPPAWYGYLMDLRSPEGECGGEVFSYEKISSMGNGFTFALESAIFTAIVYAVEKHLHGRFDQSKVAVYGDDIIVRKSSADLTIRMLNLCGFNLNLEKSFCSGPFRESCGADWFSGTPVRPVFLTSNPSTVMSLWGDDNRLRRILSLRSYGYRFKVNDLIEQWIPEQFKQCLGPLSDEDFESYRHNPMPHVRWRNGLWKFRRLVVTPKRLKGEEFLFRKLMHTLRNSAEFEPNKYYSSTWGGTRVSGAGSRFAITKPGSVVVGYSSSEVGNWASEYNDLRPWA